MTRFTLLRLLSATTLLSTALTAPTEPCEPSPIFDPDRTRLGAVASEASECTQIGLNMLAQGGNAADALVGTVFCVGTLGMYHSGIGGGGFMLVRAMNGSYEMIDFREMAPAAASQDMYHGDEDLSIYGGLASGVPGEVRGLEYLHKNYGLLPWATVMAPAIQLARYGFRVNADLVHQMDSATEDQVNFLVEDPSFAIDFAPNGTRVQLGDTMYRKRYADTLETIAMFGADAFYHGAIANATITAIRNTGGIMTLDDLANYTVEIRTPAQIAYRDFKLTSCVAPSSGIVALSALNIVKGYNDFGWPEAINASTHHLDEAMRFAYDQRSDLADPAYTPGLEQFEAEMISDATGAKIRSMITNRTHPVAYYNPEGYGISNSAGTSHIVTADASGMAISLTTTVNLLFGAQVMVPETGVILNNEMNDFSIPGTTNAFGYIPSPANYIRPGKRPLSSISPTIVEHASNSSLYFVVGAAGGSRITTATMQNLWHVLDQNMTTYAALAHPRFHDQLEPNTASFEYTYDNATTAYMKALGVNVTWEEPGMSAAQALRLLPNGTFEAAGEPRVENSRGGVI